MTSTQSQPQETTDLSRRRSGRAIVASWIGKLIGPGLFLLSGILLIVVVGLAQRLGWISAGSDAVAEAAGAEDDSDYICPMHPQIRQPYPGRCTTCGMVLVRATVSERADVDTMAVNITPAQRRLSNIQTAPATRGPVSATIHTVGAIAIDESRMATIASYVDGRLERLFADYTGVAVAEGDHLAVVYSPELYAAQAEYLASRRSLEEMSTGALAVVLQAQQRLVTNVRQKLVELGMREEQIADLEQNGSAKSRLTIYAPIGGTVIEKLAMEGKYVEAGEPIYRIADLSTVWLMLELYPEDAARIRYGQRVTAEVQSLPGEVFRGRVAFVDPTVNPSKRTVGVRVEFLNDDKRLRPGDYASATIEVPIGQQGEVYDANLAGRWISPMHPQIIRDDPGQCPICGMDLVPTSRYGFSDVPADQPTSLYVPRSAVLMAGNNSVIYVETAPGRFEIRRVVLGPILRDKIVILGGIEAGERVATAGNFLIDSQMQLAGKPSLIDPTLATTDTPSRNQPLHFEGIRVARIAGASGYKLEEFFATYFAIQQTLAEDQRPSPSAAQDLHRLAKELELDLSLPQAARDQLAKVRQHSEHLHHLELDAARHDAFRPISHAVVTLATQVRAEAASSPFFHMFCPMVKGGSGDWLQADPKLVNPYRGSQMLECGELVHEFPLGAHLEPAKDQRPDNREDAPANPLRARGT